MKLTLSALLGAVAAKRDAYIYVMDGSLWQPARVQEYFLALADAGTTHIMSSFNVYGQSGFTNGLADTVAVWAGFSADDRSSIVSKLHAKGTKLLMVAGGGNYGTIYLNYDADVWAHAVCGHAKDHNYDGVDMDLENFTGAQAQQFITWAIKATAKCRDYVGHITHAPQSPYFHPGWGNAYDALVPNVDKLLIQYYNQGASSHYDYQTTFVEDASWPAYQELATRHPNFKDKFVVGKYIYSGYGGSAMFTATQFTDAVERAEAELGYDNGIMIWRAPQMGETALYSLFINTDLPLITGIDQAESTVAPNQTEVPVVTGAPSAPPVVTGAPSAPPVVEPPVPTSAPASLPIVTAPPVVVPPDANPEVVCQSSIGCPSNSAWDAYCHDMCTMYHLSPVYCGAIELDSAGLLECVIRLHPYCAVVNPQAL
eukprot:Blabericola_migrator_1__2805@NODE_1800_length_3776_cov_766_242114_g1159_i0_p1_GENE_NODE_1800_length_3776_cov_766_242114_g1159_i0NODE_1800_length_3776_cov_766_242114_g1159_i0_p1_ORF_typecomplete_len427_score72_11Glyco_hydro_18/PF00704_28/1_4e11DUF4849/PF16141_5/0_00046_NODE_1800_length_3776_cov_766_242114_g1159_i013822662